MNSTHKEGCGSPPFLSFLSKVGTFAICISDCYVCIFTKMFHSHHRYIYIYQRSRAQIHLQTQVILHRRQGYKLGTGDQQRKGLAFSILAPCKEGAGPCPSVHLLGIFHACQIVEMASFVHSQGQIRNKEPRRLSLSFLCYPQAPVVYITFPNNTI